MTITSRLTRREASNTVGVGAVVLALTGAVLVAPAIAAADPDPTLLNLINQQRAQANPLVKPSFRTLNCRPPPTGTRRTSPPMAGGMTTTTAMERQPNCASTRRVTTGAGMARIRLRIRRRREPSTVDEQRSPQSQHARLHNARRGDGKFRFGVCRRFAHTL